MESGVFGYAHQCVYCSVAIYVACAETVNRIRQSEVVEVVERVVGSAETEGGEVRIER